MPPRTKKVAPKAAAGKTKAASKGTKRARDHEEQNKDEGNESINGARKSKKSRISEVSTVTTGQSEPEPAEPETADTPVTPSEDSSDCLKKEFSGNFDLYSMRLPFLSEVFLAKGQSKPQYEELYEKILTYQAKDDNSLQLYLQKLPSGDERGQIRSTVDAMCDPMEGMPFDVEVHDAMVTDKLPLKVNERKLFLVPPTEGPGIEGLLTVVDGGCGVDSSKGVIKLKRLWKSQKKRADGSYAELFEGFVSFNVSYSGLYKRKGHGKGEKLETAVWAVRARRNDNGEEVGIGPLKLSGWH